MVKYKVIQFKLNCLYPHKIVILRGEEVVYVNGFNKEPDTWLIKKLKHTKFLETDRGILHSRWRSELTRIQNELIRRGVKFKRFI